MYVFLFNVRQAGRDMAGGVLKLIKTLFYNKNPKLTD